MGKSLYFIKHRIATGQCNGMENNEWKRLDEIPFTDVWYNMLFNKDKPHYISLPAYFDIYLDCNKTKKIVIVIQYNPKSEFQYFITKQCICDSTLLFEIQNMQNIINKIINLETYYAPILPDDFDQYPWKYDLIYTVGDFVSGMEIDNKFAPEDKPWMTCRFTSMLPVKMEFVRKEK